MSRNCAVGSERFRRALGAGRPPALLALAFLVSLITRCAARAELTPGGDAGGHSLPVNDAGDPSVECDSANVETQCALPASGCDADGFTLVYYTAPTCQSGRCQWTRATQYCSLGCSFGACSLPLGTYTPPPSPSDATPDVVSPGDDGSSDGPSGDDGNAYGEAAPPPLATCIGEAGTCALPASVCADGRHLLYFLNPRCVGGVCQSDVQSLTCPSFCIGGACSPISITK